MPRTNFFTVGHIIYHLTCYENSLQKTLIHFDFKSVLHFSKTMNFKCFKHFNLQDFILHCWIWGRTSEKKAIYHCSIVNVTRSLRTRGGVGGGTENVCDTFLLKKVGKTIKFHVISSQSFMSFRAKVLVNFCIFYELKSITSLSDSSAVFNFSYLIRE
jgi:hypothetical protein